jgi:putative Mg2+ transporter-C (MgtC) family protein
MPGHIDGFEIALRLACALLAGGLLGVNREVKSHPAGLRTLVLVCLAAALVMIEANLLLSTKLPSGAGFTTFDVLRLPLGLLSGVGLLGAGAIIHRTEAVRGVTTASASGRGSSSSAWRPPGLASWCSGALDGPNASCRTGSGRG